MKILLAFVTFSIAVNLGGAFPIAGLPLEYAPSRQYNYHYTTDVAFNEPDITSKTSQVKKDVGFKFSAEVRLTPVWNTNNKMLVKLTVVSPVLHSVSRHDLKQDVKTLTRVPLFFEYGGSHVTRVFVAKAEPSWSANMKIAISSLLQLQREDGERPELDISGQCAATYKVDGSKITKSKFGCKNTNTAGEFHNVNRILDADIDSVSEAHYEIHNDVIQKVSTSEYHISRINMRENVASAVISSQHLELVENVVGASKIQASTIDEAVAVINGREKLKLVSHPTTAMTEVKQCNDHNCQKIAELISQIRKDLSSPATIKSAKAFLQLVESFRGHPNKRSIISALRKQENKDIVPILIDAVVAAQTSVGQEALVEFLDFKATEDVSLPERYLLAAAFSTHPSESLLRDLLELFQKNVPSETLRASIGDAMGAILYTFSRQPGNEDSKLVSEVRESVVSMLSTCEDTTCRTMQLRALGNAAVPDTLPLLVQTAAESPSPDVSEAAVKALRRFNLSLITPEMKESLKRIYHQEKRAYDSAVRTSVLNLLLELDPTQEDITAILRSTTDPFQGEFDMYVQAKLAIAADVDDNIREKLKNALKDVTLNNYHILGPKGKSLAFKENLADTGSMRATYDMFVENSKAGIMKRSGMDVDIVSPKQTLPVYSFGIFAAGLEGLLGKEVEEGQEEVEATAGLALNLMDVSLRPVTFFTGQSGLMSAVWNAPSEPVSALQANILMHDKHRRIPLQNGLVVEHDIRGVVSMDLSGSVSISLWNKNCHSLIKNSGAMLIEGSMHIDTSAFSTGLSYTADASSVIDFSTYVDFYDGIKSCLQMSRPESVFKHTVEKHELAWGFKKSYRARTQRTSTIQPASYPLPKPNNAQCRALLAD